MPTTTWSNVRAGIVLAIEAVTLNTGADYSPNPLRHAGARGVRDELETARTRTFTVRLLGAEPIGAITDREIEEWRYRAELVVAYATDRDRNRLDDMVADDMSRIVNRLRDTVINGVAGSVVPDGPYEIERGSRVWFARLPVYMHVQADASLT